MPLIPERIDIFIHVDKIVIENVEGLSQEDADEVMDALNDLEQTLAGQPAGKEKTNGD